METKLTQSLRVRLAVLLALAAPTALAAPATARADAVRSGT